MPIPDMPPLAEAWDEEACERAWRNVQRLIKEGDQRAAAILLAQLRANGGEPWTMGQATEEDEPYNPTAMYTALLKHLHGMSLWDWKETDYREIQGIARELTQLLERENTPPPEPTRSREEQEMRQEAMAASLAQRGMLAYPKAYTGPVVSIN